MKIDGSISFVGHRAESGQEGGGRNFPPSQLILFSKLQFGALSSSIARIYVFGHSGVSMRPQWPDPDGPVC